MRAFLMNGGRGDGGRDDGLAAVEQSLHQALQAHGYDVDRALLWEVPIAYCRGCFECWTRTPGVCRTDDDARDIARRFMQSDLVVLLTPVTFGGYSSHLKKALDRAIGILSPFFFRVDGETHHRRRYRRYPALLGVGVLPAPDLEDESIFRDLVRRNAINLRVPAHAAAVLYGSDDPVTLRHRLDALLDAVMVAA
jgi:hypothetical protein